MLSRTAKPVFVAACACNLALSVMSAYALIGFYPSVSFVALLAGGFAFVVAATLAFIVLSDSHGLDRPWIKAAFVFLALGPIAFWFLQQPAVAEATCIDRCYGAETEAIVARAFDDIVQSQLAMIVVAAAAMLCAARAMTVMLDELAA